MWMWCNVMSLHCSLPFQLWQTPSNPQTKWPSEEGWWWQWTLWPQTCPGLIHCRRRQNSIVYTACQWQCTISYIHSCAVNIPWHCPTPLPAIKHSRVSGRTQLHQFFSQYSTFSGCSDASITCLHTVSAFPLRCWLHPFTLSYCHI